MGGAIAMSKKGSFDMIVNNMDAEKATKVLVKSLYRELRNNGFSEKDIVNFSTALVEHMVSESKTVTPAPAIRERRLG